MTVELLNCDCMTYMRELPDKAFDLAIVDPPYGLGKRLTTGRGFNRNRFSATAMADKNWDVRPGPEYFRELLRVSKNQCIFGGNYFIDYLQPSRCVVAWVKKEMRGHPHYSQFELIWTSFDRSAKVIETYSTNSGRIHPTQKPTALYERLFAEFVGLEYPDVLDFKILDTRLGSGSSAIAAHYFGCDFVGCELDPDYHDDAVKRFAAETAQEDMFSEASA